MISCLMCRKHENMLMLLVILELFCCLHVSEAIKCYQCNSLITPDCGEPFKTDSTTMKTCEDNSKDAVCYKVRKPHSGQFMIYFCDIYRNLCNSFELTDISSTLYQNTYIKTHLFNISYPSPCDCTVPVQ